MRVLVAGGAGFLGSHFCERLVAEGHSVLCVDSLLTGREENLTELRGEARFSFERGDIGGPARWGGGWGAVCNFASPASPRDYQKYPVETLRAGAFGTFQCLELARADQGFFLLASTSEVYGDPREHPQKESYWGHVNPVGPRACYDEAKRFAEALTTTYRRHHGVNTRIARIFNTYGPRMRLEDGRVAPTLIAQALREEPMTVFGDGGQTRCFCHVEDMVEGLFRLLFAPDGAGELATPVNLGNPEEITIRQFAALVREVTESAAPIVHAPLPKDDPQRRRPDITRARALLGWTPRISLAEGLRRTVAHWRQELATPAAA